MKNTFTVFLFGLVASIKNMLILILMSATIRFDFVVLLGFLLWGVDLVLFMFLDDGQEKG